MKKQYNNWVQFVLGLSKATQKNPSRPTHVHYHVHVHMDEPKLYQRVLEQVTGELPLSLAPVPQPVTLEVPSHQVY
jgi:hypothetical protein